MTDSAPRAVGRACGRNPIPIIIPCHRVLARGGLGGYSGGAGLATKQHAAWPSKATPSPSPTVTAAPQPPMAPRTAITISQH